MLISILRTIVPALWGSFIVWLLGVVPVLEPLRADLLAYGDLAVPVISAVIIGAWYALWRKVEPHLPAWLTRILLGSAQAPVYESRPTVDAYAQGGPLDGFSEANGRHEAITQDYTDDTTIHSVGHAAYPVSDPHGPTQADPDRYTQ